MKILFLTMWYPNAENPIFGTFVHEQVVALKETGVDVRVVQPIPLAPFPLTWLSKRYKRLSEIPLQEEYKGVKVFHPRYLTLPKNLLYHKTGAWMYAGVREMINRIYADWPFQIIHAHETFPCGWVANKLREKDIKKIKTIHTIHRVSIIDVPKRSQQCFDRVIESLVEADCNIFVSREGIRLAQDYTQNRICEKTHYITNGVNISQFELGATDQAEYQQLKEQNGNFLNIIFIGYLIERKGIVELLHAIKDLKKYNFEKPLRFFLVGRNMMGNYISDFIRKHSLEDTVILTGLVLHDKIKIWMKFADIFILPSRSEGLATVLFESLYMGTASIFTNVGGTTDVVTHMENAFIIEPKSTEQICKAIYQLATDPGLRQKLGQNGHKLIKEKYTWTINAEKNLAIYQSLTKGNS